MGSDVVTCAVCGKQLAYDDAYGTVEHAGAAYQVCCKGCMERFKQEPGAYAK
jgi:YHS domain-containing protein